MNEEKVIENYLKLSTLDKFGPCERPKIENYIIISQCECEIPENLRWHWLSKLQIKID